MRNIDKLKAYLKETARQIRETKPALKEAQRGKGTEPTYQLEGRLAQLKYEYRHHHIAYCELRGKTRDQIENTVKENNNPNETYINNILDAYAWTQDEITAYLERKAKNEAIYN